MTQPKARPMIRTTNLGRRFGENWAIRGVDLEIAAGEVVGLLGPNGAGKTTTVRLLAALIEPSEGDAWLDGLDVRREPDEVRGRVGILTESPGLYDKLSATRNLDFFGRLHRIPAELRAERIERLLRLFDLWDRRDDAAGAFSKGMRQKLAIARALLHEPRVLFLDEPTAALDPEAAFIVRDAIVQLKREGRTIVLATHNLDEANRLCDRIAFVRGGIVRVDSPALLRGVLNGRAVEVTLDAPASEELVQVATAIPGARNVAARDGRLTFTLDDPERDTPAIIRALVAANAGIVEVRQTAASLEDVYFDVMGVRPGAGGKAA
jgi:ABC-2 type transport system ATP-binding protein